MHFGDNVGVLGQTEHVQDQSDSAIAHDRGPGETGDALELFAQRLDHDFLGIIDFINDQAELASVGLQNDNVDHRLVGGARDGLLRVGFQLQIAIQISQGEQLAAQAVDGRAVKHFDALAGLLRLPAAPTRAN